MLAQDIKPRMDITGLTVVSGTEIQQITSTAMPGDDKGFVLITTDPADGIPNVPNPAVVTQGITPKHWERYVWIRKPAAVATTVKRNIVYTWNPIRVNNATLLKWEPIDELITLSIDNSAEALKKANEALSKANEALAMSKLTDEELDEVKADLVILEEKILGHEATIKGLLTREPGIGTDNGSTRYIYILKVDPVQTELRDGQTIRFICPVTSDIEPKLQMMDWGKDAVPEQPEVPASGDNPAIPAVPAQPAVPPKNIGEAAYLSRIGSMGNQMRVYTGDMVKGQYIEVTYNKVLNLWCLTLGVTVDGIARPFDLTVRSNPLAPTTSVGIRAHAITFTNNLTVGTRIKHSIDLLCSTAVKGLGGLDHDLPVVASRWYYIWVIFNGETRTAATLFSLSGYNPTIPVGSGYTHKCLVGQVYCDAGSLLREFFQKDDTVWFKPIDIFTNKTLAGPNYVALDAEPEQRVLNTIIPLNAVSVSGNMGKQGGTELVTMYVAGNGNGVGEVGMVDVSTDVLSEGWSIMNSFRDVPLITTLIEPDQPLVTPHTLYCKSTFNKALYRLQISSYKFHSIYIWN